MSDAIARNVDKTTSSSESEPLSTKATRKRSRTRFVRLLPFFQAAFMFFFCFELKEPTRIGNLFVKLCPCFALILFCLSIIADVVDSEEKRVTVTLGRLFSLSGIKEEWDSISYERRIFWGLIFCVIGDVFMFYRRTTPNCLEAAILFFGIAHFFFIRAFMLAQSETRQPISSAMKFAIFLPCGVTGFPFLLSLPTFYYEKGLLVATAGILYGLTVVLMAWSALVGFLETGCRYFLAAFIGGVCFVMSDDVIALASYQKPLWRTYGFRTDASTHWFIMATYYSALCFICTSMLSPREKHISATKKSQ